MGDRTNPIKFGPEWLRNLSHERAITASRSSPGAGATPPGMGGPRPSPNPTNSAPRILLARLRYGREEMLALYDPQTAEAPAQLKSNDTLYQPRGKPPYALNTFEEDTRENVPRQTMGGGLLNPNDRYSGRGRGQTATESKNVQQRVGDLRTARTRGYMRSVSSSAVRGWNSNRIGYNGIPDEDPSQPLRPWNNNNNGNQPNLRTNNGEPPEWQSKPAQYRSKRQTNTNWRQQPGREDGEEWRSTDGGGGARRPQDKWAEWGWQQESGGRQTQDKQWHSNRRNWVGGDTNEDSLPEWAVDNAEACGGTFDSTGAFHGYSNDDSNLPKTQENLYPLTKSLTHGSFSNRSKIAEEGSEEWWASEKAKKLSPKRFDTTDIKKGRYTDGDFKKLVSADPPGEANWSAGTSKAGDSNDRNTGAIPKKPAQVLTKGADIKLRSQPEQATPNQDDEKTGPVQNPQITSKSEVSTKLEEKVKTDESSKEKPYDSCFENEKQNEKGNIQSVIITSNNSLRQKHQNIAVTPTETPKRRPNAIIKYYEDQQQDNKERDTGEFNAATGAATTDDDKLVEDILKMSLEDGIPSATINQLLTNHSGSTMNSFVQIPYPSMQTRMSGGGLQGLGLPQASQIQTPDAYMVQSMGVPNSMLNESLGLPLPSAGSGVSPALSGTGLQSNLPLGLQGSVGAGLQPTAPAVPHSPMQAQHVQGFGVQPPNMQNQMAMPESMQATSSAHNLYNVKPIHEPNRSHVNPMQQVKQEYAMPGLGQLAYNNMFDNVRNQASPLNMELDPPMPPPYWYYEDPSNVIQGPFSSQEMYNWYIAGFFSSQLMVRRTCDAAMRPLGSYGPMPFTPTYDMMSVFGSYKAANQQAHDAPAQQPGLGANSSEMPSTPLLPETMKTEDEILAQMRAAQALPRPPSPLSFFAEPPPAAAPAPEAAAVAPVAAAVAPAAAAPAPEAAAVAPAAAVAAHDVEASNVNQLHKLIRKEAAEAAADTTPPEQAPEKADKADTSEVSAVKANKSEKAAEVKPTKEVKKQKSKETAATVKSKKIKDDKKEETVETKPKDDEVKVEKRSAEPSPSGKNKKEDKSSKKDLDKEKKEWIKEGFTIVKGAEKTKDKDSKKKVEEAKAAEEAERKKKEEEKLAAEEKKRLQETKKQQEAESGGQSASRLAAESLSKKAPWSGASQPPPPRDGPTLAEIQRLEREKKLEQMKEQQQMMQLIAQQQAAALAREQEMQTGLGWAKKTNSASTGPTLAEIQAEARKQASVAAAVVPREEAQPTPPPVAVPWATLHNGGDGYISGGFWDSPPAEPVKPAPKQAEPKAEAKNKKKVTVMAPPKRENSPSVEFDMWCTNMLVSWRDTGIDVPTFVSFLRDIESPYEVKDYVKCYLGDTRESNDFARQFLEKRSRLMRVGMVTPSDDLCSPAVAVNPRTNSTSDHADLKAKTKKTKKNKMLKVDARNILGFSVTASEDRINVGDIDTV